MIAPFTSYPARNELVPRVTKNTAYVIQEEESGISIRAENLPFEIELKSVIAIESQTLNRLDPILENSSTRFVCEFCGRAFDSENEMRTHARTHEKKPFVCELCDITFESWSARRIHQREHTGGEQVRIDLSFFSIMNSLF